MQKNRFRSGASVLLKFHRASVSLELLQSESGKFNDEVQPFREPEQNTTPDVVNGVLAPRPSEIVAAGHCIEFTVPPRTVCGFMTTCFLLVTAAFAGYTYAVWWSVAVDVDSKCFRFASAVVPTRKE
jgi:hypothetical protein